jgi:Domain of unknown function (DUF1707)
VTGPWDPMAAASRGGMRVSDADRERVLGALQAAFARGLLTRDDFDTRAAQALASRTAADLAAVISGLTASHQPSAAVRMAETSRRWNSPKLVALGAALIVLPPALVAAFLTFYGGFIVLFLVACVGTVLAATPPGSRRPGPLP